MTLEEVARSRRVALFAHYHASNILAEHVLLYLEALADAGFRVVVITTCALSSADERQLAGACVYLIKRPNTGHDFGSWIEALRQLPPLEAELLLLTNDSVYAPVGDLGAFVEGLFAAPADFYGAIESLEYRRHLQSWFVLLRPAAYNAPSFRALFGAPVPACLPKVEIIERYEVGLSQGLYADGLTSHAAYSPRSRSLLGQSGGLNAGHLLWREMIEAMGIPFLKVQLLRDNPHHIANLAAWPDVVRRRNPALAEAIAADLAVRRSATGAQAKVRWQETLRDNNPFTWPELQSFLRRDFAVSARPTLAKVNRLGFRIAIRLAKLARRVGRR